MHFSVLLGVSSCVFESTDCPSTDEPLMVYLSFKVVAPSAAYSEDTRGELITSPDGNNYFEEASGEYEKISQLRVIIMRPDWEIEQNHLVSFSNGTVSYDNEPFKVVSGEKKKIYLLANSENLGYDFDRLRPGTYYNAPYIEDIIIKTTEVGGTIIDNTSSEKKYIPMSEMYEIMVETPETVKKDTKVDIGTLFVTRAAVKFSFQISSEYGTGLWIKEIIFNQLANQEYLVPNETKYYPPKYTDPVKNWNGTSSWGDKTDPDLYGRFITSYTTPASATYSQVIITPITPIELGPDTTFCSPALYYCESKYIPNDNRAATSPYSVSITVVEKDDEGNLVDGSDYTFVPISLPNLPLLPRNTHVKVKIRLGKTTIDECVVELLPYIGVELNPQFGVNRDQTTTETPPDNTNPSDNTDPSDNTGTSDNSSGN